ncbi:hypothetical protein ACJDT4_21270 [Clostridium neuense]|uniref:AAA+ ATPase domain-containing protein n=1 Tax=Clostridium neuense TaxID=1728934 RepID=A0ABW8TK95_9CLOT
MSKINAIQQAIMGLDGGEYQKLMDAYLYKKFNYNNIEPLGSHTGSNKVTKGIPDSYVKLNNGKYVLIMYGSVNSTSYDKIEKDIKSCLNKEKLDIDIEEIEEIICCYTSTNIHIEQRQKLEGMIDGIKITLIGIGTVAHDLLIKYPVIAVDFLSIPMDTEQIFEIDDFIDKYDKNGMNAPINMELLHRENEIESLMGKLESSKVVLIFGKSGVGKTRLALEIARIYKGKHKSHVLCVKNNGQMIYNDLKYYISDSGDYLLFIDDANQTTQLNHVLDYVIEPPERVNVRIIMTIRDYARDRVKKIIYDKIIPQEEEIGVLSDEIIKEILDNNLGIKNNKWLNQIAKISKGNARLAVLAGKIALKRGFLSIYNSVDIFKYYYGDVIEKEFPNKKKIISAFVITLLGPFEYKNNEIAIKILSDNDINEDEFYQLCCELNDSEIIDLYMDRVVKISDQSMGDYLLYYVLIEKKYVALMDILKDMFKQCKNKIIYALNTIVTLFNTKECLTYIKEQVNKAWDTVEDDNEEFEYIKSFHVLNEEKSLAYIKKKIDKMDEENKVLDKFNFKDKKNNNSIKSEIVEVLGGFKYSDDYESVLELSIYYFKKRPSEVMDFYFLFSDRLGYDQNSYDYGYKSETLNIEYLWKESNDGLDINITILLLNIIENYIIFEVHTTENNGTRSVNFITFSLCMCDGLERLRKTIWSILGGLYGNERYKDIINEILLNYRPYSNNKEQLKLIYEMDFKFIKDYIFKQIVSPDFIQCNILNHFTRISERLEVTVDDVLKKYEENEEFLIYNTLTKEHEIGADWEKEEEKRKENILNMVRDYNKEDFVKLFKLCNDILDKFKNNKQWELQEGITFLFDGIKGNTDQYIIAIKSYLKCDTPYSIWIGDKISILINLVGVKETERILLQYEYEQKNRWIYEFLFCIPKEELNIRYAGMLREIFEEEIKKEQPLIPNFQIIVKYKDIDESIVKDLSLKLLTINSNQRAHAIQSFLGRVSDNNYVGKLFAIFNKDIDILEKLYLNASESQDNIDYEGNLFISLVKNNIEFLKEFMKKIIEMDNTYNYTRIYEKLWQQENYNELVKISFNTIINFKDTLGFWSYETRLEKIFISNTNTTKIISDRKVQWIKNYINTFSNNIECLNFIFQIIVSVFSYNKKEFILYFLSKNKDIEIFKRISLFSRTKSWSGSEVPLIEKEIKFLSELIESINGIDYIEHKAYLKELISSKEKYKQHVLIQEYLDDRYLS